MPPAPPRWAARHQLDAAAKVAQALGVTLDALAGLGPEPAPTPVAEPAGGKRKGRKKGE